MTRKICVVTGTRAEFGLLRWLMQDIKIEPECELQVIATGMHLSPDFGLTYKEIEQAGLPIDWKVEMLLGADTPSAIAKSMGLGMIGFADAFAQLKPDLLVVLGDRFEIMAAVSAALILGIPVAHLHGGETTEGAFDEAIRHSLTKMSHLHFVAAEEYRRRVIQLGEDPARVFLVGGLGVDVLKRIELLDRPALEQSLDFKLGNKNLLITFHPVTLDHQSSSDQMQALLDVLAELDDTHLVFTMPNADTGCKELTRMVEAFVASHPHAKAFTSLGQLRYLSCMKYVDAVVGNSSSGLTEAPSVGVGTVDIGDRQKGRLAADSVIHCEPTRDDIREALRRIYEPPFRSALPYIRNPYGNGGASRSIVEVIKGHALDHLLKKSFFDLPIPALACLY